MATETPNVIHAQAIIGLVSDAPTLLKSAGFSQFLRVGAGRYILVFETGITPQNAQVTACGRNGYAPAITAGIAINGQQTYVDVQCFGIDGAAWDVPISVVVTDIPPVDATATGESSNTGAVNWEDPTPGAVPWSTTPIVPPLAELVAVGLTDVDGLVTSTQGPLTLISKVSTGVYQFGHPLIDGLNRQNVQITPRSITKIVVNYTILSASSIEVTCWDADNDIVQDSSLDIQVWSFIGQ